MRNGLSYNVYVSLQEQGQGAVEKFKDEVRFIDNRYEIKLPFMEGYSPVPDNYSLSQETHKVVKQAERR